MRRALPPLLALVLAMIQRLSLPLREGGAEQ